MLVDDRSSYKRQKYTEVDSENEMPLLIIRDVPVPPSSLPALPSPPQSLSLLSSTVTTRSQAITTPKTAAPKHAVSPDVESLIEDVNPPPKNNSVSDKDTLVEEIVSLPGSPGDYPDCVTSQTMTGNAVSMDVPSTSHVTVSDTAIAPWPNRSTPSHVTTTPDTPVSANTLPDCTQPHIDTDNVAIIAEEGGSLESTDDDKSSSEGEKDDDYVVDSADSLSSDEDDSYGSSQESSDNNNLSSDEDDSSRKSTPIKLKQPQFTKKDENKVINNNI